MTEKKPITLAGIPIRMGKLKKKLAKAKRVHDSELQMEIQQNIDQLVAEKEQLEKFQAANPPEVEKPAAGPAPVAVSAGVTLQESALAVRTIIGVENKILSAVAGQRFEMRVSEDDRKSMEEAFSLSASKRLTPEKKEKLDLIFLILAFASPLVEALPAAAAMRKANRPRPAEQTEQTKLDVVADDKLKVTVETPGPVSVVDVAGPIPPPVG